MERNDGLKKLIKLTGERAKLDAKANGTYVVYKDIAGKLVKEYVENQSNRNLTITDIDLMTGIEFEIFISELFRNLKYKTNITKSTGDQGIDIIVEKNGVKYGIQAKCYSSTVSNKAVQEVVAGIKHYQLDKGIVVTNNYFTKSATELAMSNNIILWDRNMLKQKLEEMNE